MALTDVLRRLNFLKFLYPNADGLGYEQAAHDTEKQRHLASDHTTGIVSGLAVAEDAPASMTVVVAIGRATDPSGDASQVVSAVDVDLTSFIPGGGTQTVYIIVEYGLTEISPYVVPELGTSQNKYNQETPAVSAQLAAPTGDEVEIARVEIAAAAAQIDDAANPDYPANNEIDMRYRKYANTKGLSLQVSVGAADTPLSAVTVGASNCDFRDLAAAIAYVTALTRSATRQMTILVFEKTNAEAWTPGAVMIIPTWTHLVGVGRPSFTFTGVAGNLITLGEGASVENLYVKVDDSWTRVFSTTDDDATVRDVDVQYDDAAADNAAYVFYAGTADRFRLLNCKLFRDDGGVKGTYGLSIVDSDDFIIENCYFEGTKNLLDVDSDCDRGHINNLTLKSNDSGGATVASYIQGKAHQLSNVYVYVTAGAQRGLSLKGASGGDTINAVNVTVEVSAVDDDIIALKLDYCHMSNPAVKEGRVEFTDGCTISGGFVSFTGTHASAAVEAFGSRNILSGLRIDRGGQAQPCINSNAGATENQVIGCRCDGTTVASIDNTEAAATDWLLVGNMVDVATAVGNGWDFVGEKVI